MKKIIKTLQLERDLAQHLYYMWVAIYQQDYQEAMTWQFMYLADRELHRAYIFSFNSAEFYKYMNCSAIALEGQP
jgi:hypothetical protein